jgi:hypothetical protein
MTSTPVSFAGITRGPAPERPGIVKAVDAPDLPGFELNRPIRAPSFPPRRPPKTVLPLFSDAPARHRPS